MSAARRVAALLLGAAGLSAQDHVAVPLGDLVVPAARPVPFLAAGGRRLHDEEDLPRIRGSEALAVVDDAGAVSVPVRGPFAAPLLRDVLVRFLGIESDAVVLAPGGVGLRVRAAELANVQRALEAVRRTVPPRLQLQLRLLRTRGGKAVELLRETADLVPGLARALGELRERDALAGFELEVAESAVIGQPRRLVCAAGATLVLRPRCAPQGERMVLDGILRVVEPFDAGRIATGNSSFGDLDRLATTSCSLAFTAPLDSGVPAVVEWTHGTDDALRLECTPRWSPQPQPPEAGQLYYDAAMVDAPGFATLVPLPGDDKPAAAPPVPDGGMATHDGAPTAPWLVQGPAALPARLLAANWFRDQVRPVHLDLRLLDVPTGTTATAEAVPAGAKVLFAAALPLLLEQTAVVHDLRIQNVLGDWNAEIAKAARGVAPHVHALVTGLVADVRAGAGACELHGELSQLFGIERIETPLNQSLPVTGDGNAAALPADRVAVELPTVHRVPLALRIALDKAGNGVLQRACTLLGEGHDLVVQVAVRRP